MSSLFFLPAGRRGALAAVLIGLGFGFVAGRYSAPWSSSDVPAPGDDARFTSAPAATLIERRQSSAPVSENEPRAEHPRKEAGENAGEIAVQREVVPFHDVADEAGEQGRMTLACFHAGPPVGLR